jgi:hypothetical protein
VLPHEASDGIAGRELAVPAIGGLDKADLPTFG